MSEITPDVSTEQAQEHGGPRPPSGGGSIPLALLSGGNDLIVRYDMNSGRFVSRIEFPREGVYVESAGNDLPSALARLDAELAEQVPYLLEDRSVAVGA